MILATTFVYNERPYIEDWANYYRSQGCELFVLDNMSNDGTWEWLCENDIQRARIDTDESFHLEVLQKELNNHIHRIKPFWVIYAGADLFFWLPNRIDETVKKLADEGYNQFGVLCYSALNTGEKFGTPLYYHYYKAAPYRNLYMNAKYDEGFKIERDHIHLKERRIKDIEGVMVNYGGCKPAAEQEEKLARREKAWAQGLDKVVGKHIRAGKGVNWTYKCDNDLMDTEHWKYISKWL
jgi:hypothetical protein